MLKMASVLQRMKILTHCADRLKGLNLIVQKILWWIFYSSSTQLMLMLPESTGGDEPFQQLSRPISQLSKTEDDVCILSCYLAAIIFLTSLTLIHSINHLETKLQNIFYSLTGLGFIPPCGATGNSPSLIGWAEHRKTLVCGFCHSLVDFPNVTSKTDWMNMCCWRKQEYLQQHQIRM